MVTGKQEAKEVIQEKNAIAYQEVLAPIEYDVDGNKIKLTPQIVKQFITNGVDVSIQEYKLFAELCKVRKLNPFLREAYLIKYSQTLPAQIVVGKDAILKRAVLHPEFDGRKQGVIVITEKGETVHRTGSFKLPSDTLVGGWATVYRKDWKYPVEVTVSFDEVKQTKGSNGEANSNWASKGGTMVEKVALVRALREAFVEDLGGLIEENEAWEVSQKSDKPDRVIITQNEVLDNPEVPKTDEPQKKTSLKDV